jgi:hypothetical protein
MAPGHGTSDLESVVRVVDPVRARRPQIYSLMAARGQPALQVLFEPKPAVVRAERDLHFTNVSQLYLSGLLPSMTAKNAC